MTHASPDGADNPVGRASGGREVAGASCRGHTSSTGTGGQDGGCPDGAGRRLMMNVGDRHQAGDTPNECASLVPRLHSWSGAGRSSAVALRGRPECGGGGGRCPPRQLEWGRSVPRVLPPERSDGGGRRRQRGRRGLLQCCNAEPRREPSLPARLRSAAPPLLLQCRCEHRPEPSRTGSGIPCPAGPPAAPTAPNFGSTSRSGPSFVFLPLLPGPRDVSSRPVSPGPPARPVFAERVGAHPAPDAGPPWATPAVTLALRGFWLRLPPAP